MPNEAEQRRWNNPEVIERWKIVEPSTAQAEAPLFAALQPRPGERILDIGCGGGGTTLRAATDVGPTGLAVGCDISAPLLDLATSRARERGLTNVAFHEGDAQVADIPGGPFDAAISRYGVMFFAEPPAAFANIRRHLKAWRPSRLRLLARTRHQLRVPVPDRRPLRPTPAALRIRAAGPVRARRRGLPQKHPRASRLPRHLRYQPRIRLAKDPPGLFSGPAQVAPLGLSPERAEQALAELRAYESQSLKDGMLHAVRRFAVVTARNP